MEGDDQQQEVPIRRREATSTARRKGSPRMTKGATASDASMPRMHSVALREEGEGENKEEDEKKERREEGVPLLVDVAEDILIRSEGKDSSRVRLLSHRRVELEGNGRERLHIRAILKGGR